MDKECKVVSLGNKYEDDLFNALANIKEPADIGTILMYHIINNYEKEEIVDVVKLILNRLFTDFLTYELPQGDLEKIKKIIDKI